jgi:opacity protein-like surface antigen
MKSFLKAAAVLAISLAALATAQAQQILSDYDHHTNFSQYRTYSWQKIDAPDSIWQGRIKAAADAQLAAKGWTRVAEGGDAVLSATSNEEEAATMEHVPGGWGPGWRWRGWNEPVSYDEGTLTINIFDAKTQALVWRGFSSQTVSSKDQKNLNKLDKVVAKLFKNFPPKD